MIRTRSVRSVMHELSIAMGIVDVAAEEAAKRDGRVLAVHLRLGPLAGVIKEALLSAYELACEGSPLAGSRLVVEDIPLVAFCERCEAEREVASFPEMACPHCGTLMPRVVRGTELEVFALEISP